VRGWIREIGLRTYTEENALLAAEALFYGGIQPSAIAVEIPV
jgi:hypothetical protein